MNPVLEEVQEESFRAEGIEVMAKARISRVSHHVKRFSLETEGDLFG
ncbi:MAG: hypothetical protein ACYCYP_07580 [Leptospirales bacterium]